MKLDREAKIATMTMQEFNELLEYSYSLPTGTTAGKVWKRQIGDDWWLGQYGDAQPIAGSNGEANVPIYWYQIGIDAGYDKHLY